MPSKRASCGDEREPQPSSVMAVWVMASIQKREITSLLVHKRVLPYLCGLSGISSLTVSINSGVSHSFCDVL